MRKEKYSTNIRGRKDSISNREDNDDNTHV